MKTLLNTSVDNPDRALIVPGESERSQTDRRSKWPELHIGAAVSRQALVIVTYRGAG